MEYPIFNAVLVVVFAFAVGLGVYNGLQRHGGFPYLRKW